VNGVMAVICVISLNSVASGAMQLRYCVEVIPILSAIKCCQKNVVFGNL